MYTFRAQAIFSPRSGVLLQTACAEQGRAPQETLACASRLQRTIDDTAGKLRAAGEQAQRKRQEGATVQLTDAGSKARLKQVRFREHARHTAKASLFKQKHSGLPLVLTDADVRLLCLCFRVCQRQRQSLCSEL